MKPARVGAIAVRILKQFRHDRRTVALIVIVPLLVMALIGYLIGDAGKEPLPVAVVNLGPDAVTPGGAPSLGAMLTQQLRANDAIEVRTASSEREATELVRSGDVAGAVIVPQGGSPRMLSGTAEIRVIVGGFEPTLQGPVLEAVRSAVAGLAAAGVGMAAPAVVIRPDPLRGGLGLSTLDYNAPALVAVFAFFFTFLLTSVGFLRERSSGTLERLMASPATRIELLLGYLLGFIGAAMVQSLIVLGYAVWVLDVPVRGSIWLVLLIIAILVVGSVALGIALSFYARNELQVVQFIPLVILPQIFLGGLLWPVQTLWPPLRVLSQVFPLTQAVYCLRAVMIGGDTAADIAARILLLIALSGAMLALGVFVLRKQRA